MCLKKSFDDTEKAMQPDKTAQKRTVFSVCTQIFFLL